MKNMFMLLSAQQPGCIFVSFRYSVYLDLAGSMYHVPPHLVLPHSRGCSLSLPVHIKCFFWNFLDSPIIIPSFPLTPHCEVNLKTLDDSKFKGWATSHFPHSCTFFPYNHNLHISLLSETASESNLFFFFFLILHLISFVQFIERDS